MYQATFEVRVKPNQPTVSDTVILESTGEGEFIFFASIHILGLCPCNARHFLNVAVESEFPESGNSSRRACLISLTGVSEGTEEETNTVIFSRSSPTDSKYLETEYVNVGKFPEKSRGYRNVDGITVRWSE